MSIDFIFKKNGVVYVIDDGMWATAGGGDVTRTFVQLNSSLSSNFELDTSASFNGDFVFTQLIYITQITSVIRVFGNGSGFQSRLSINSDMSINVRSILGNYSTAAGVFTGLGKYGELRLSRDSGVTKIHWEGVEIASTGTITDGFDIELLNRQSGSYSGDTYIAGKTSFMDLSSPENNQCYNLDLATGSSELSKEGNHSILYTNIPDNQRELYQLNDNCDWDNIAPDPKLLPLLIEAGCVSSGEFTSEFTVEFT